MTWVLTFTGRRFYPLDPQPEEVCIEDIARSLAMQCRFNGHVRKFYSVAEHCVLASRLAPQAYALEALLHDATEAYLCDLVRPLKDHVHVYVGGDHGLLFWREAEARIHAVIAQVFGIPAVESPVVKEIDLSLMWAEKAQLLPESPYLWDAPRAKAADVVLECWGPYEAEDAFLARFEELRRR